MEVIKIFDRPYVRDTTAYTVGFIKIISIFHIKGVDITKISHLIAKFMKSDIFPLLLRHAGRLINIRPECLIQYYISATDDIDGWYVHPLLVKSFLRYINESIEKYIIARIIYKFEKWYLLDAINNASLLSIVEDVKKPDSIKIDNSDKKYNCDTILNKNDMFDDDLLVLECTKHIVLEVLTTFFFKDLCNIVCSMISV
jgi:hypothetical protein